MNQFFERTPVPKWRLISYGLLATASISALGLYLNERSLIIAAAFFGFFIVGFAFVLDAVRTKATPQWRRIGRWLLYAGLLVVIALKLWDILSKH
jgi:hypothetical protein